MVAIVDDPALGEDEALALASVRDRAPRDRRPGRLLVAAGRLVSQKRFDLLLRAFARGARDDDRLVILGEGPCRRRLEALVARLGLGERVRLAGFSADINDWLARADLFVLSSAYEGVPAVVIEALAAGVPIIASDCSVSLPAMLGDGRFGRLVAPGDVAGLAAALGADAPRIDVAAARAHARRFLVETAAPAYLALLRAAAAPAGAEAVAPAGRQDRAGNPVEEKSCARGTDQWDTCGGRNDDPFADAGPGQRPLHPVESLAWRCGGPVPAARAWARDPGAGGGAA
jgi:hypothetical protein